MNTGTMKMWNLWHDWKWVLRTPATLVRSSTFELLEPISMVHIAPTELVHICTSKYYLTC